MKHLLEADGIQLAFGSRSILSDVYLKMETGKITGLLGRNGSGKSCLLSVIYGTLKAEKSVRIDGKCCYQAYRQPELLRYLPQFNFIPKSLSIKRVLNDFTIDEAVFHKAFPEFADKYLQPAGKLSGGELRLLELYVIAKAAAWFVLLDEPFTHLNPLQVEKAMQLLAEEKANKGILITDHLYRHVTALSDQLCVLLNGKLHPATNEATIEQLGYAKL